MNQRLMDRRDWLKTSAGLMAATSFAHTLHRQKKQDT